MDKYMETLKDLYEDYIEGKKAGSPITDANLYNALEAVLRVAEKDNEIGVAEMHLLVNLRDAYHTDFIKQTT